MKLEVFRREREAILEEKRRLREEELYRQEVIRQAKEQLRYEMGQIGDFMPRGVADTEEELRQIKSQQNQQRLQYQDYFRQK